jgi:hypothetical protein
MNREAREQVLEEIRENIARFGHHLYVVTGEQQPRYAYTIGLTQRFGFELVFAGGIFFIYKDVSKIFAGIVQQLATLEAPDNAARVVEPYGSFSFRPCDTSWVRLLMLGAMDFYQRPDLHSLQIVPDDEHMTLDVPDLSIPWSPQSAPVWRWLKEPWTYSAPLTSHAATDLNALRGSPITEACRWEVDYWELFAGAGPEVPNEEKRVVSLGTLLAVDPNLAPVLDLKIGDGIWREDGSKWHVWKRHQTE